MTSPPAGMWFPEPLPNEPFRSDEAPPSQPPLMRPGPNVALGGFAAPAAAAHAAAATSRRTVIVTSINPLVGLLLLAFVIMPLVMGWNVLGDAAALDRADGDSGIFSQAAASMRVRGALGMAIGVLVAVLLGPTMLICAGILKPMVGLATPSGPVLVVRSGLLAARKKLSLSRGATIRIEKVKMTLSSTETPDSLASTVITLAASGRSVTGRMFGPFDATRHRRLETWCAAHGVALDPSTADALPLEVKRAEDEQAEGRARIERSIVSVFRPND